jgi:ankyrin only family protein
MHIGNLRMSSEEQTNKLLESGEIGRDSGFLSGACTTESDLSQTSACDLGASASCSSTSYHRLDSGVDVSDHLSQLNISEETKTITVLPHKLGDPSELPPWEYFFAPDQDGDTQLHIGVMEGYVEEVFTLIALVPHPSILDFQNDLCQTALHVAVLSKHPRIARRLVAAGARVDMRDRNGNTPLHLACQIGDIGCVQALTMALSAVETQQCQLRYAAFAQTLPQQLDLLNYDGQAPIHLAAMGGHCDVIRALHWLGTDLNATDGKGGRTALHYTVERGHVGALRCLVSECGCNLEIETYGGLTAYQMASETNNSQISQELLRMGAVPHPNRMDESDSDSDVP